MSSSRELLRLKEVWLLLQPVPVKQHSSWRLLLWPTPETILSLLPTYVRNPVLRFYFAKDQETRE
jgi:hypothetical protein